MIKRFMCFGVALAAIAALSFAQEQRRPLSPAGTAATQVGGK
jgi:predicted outer membrane protein